jgi:hypothetical protein
LPEDVAKRLPRYPLVPATLIGRLAIDRRYHRQGWDNFLLLDALYRCSRSEVTAFAVIVDSLDDEAHLLCASQLFAFAGFSVSLIPTHGRHRGAIQMSARRPLRAAGDAVAATS